MKGSDRYIETGRDEMKERGETKRGEVFHSDDVRKSWVEEFYSSLRREY